VVVGSVLPMLLLWHPSLRSERSMLAAALLVVVGGFAFLYVFIIGGQLFPLEIFPGHEVRSSFGDGAVASYRPSWPEFVLGVGGLGVAFLMTVVGVRVLDFLPQDAPDDVKRDAKAVVKADVKAAPGAAAKPTTKA
jgi:molybdopterin-containing oxidoreductase family membrane subunit